MKIALIVAGIVVVGAVVFFLVQRQASVSAKAGSGVADIDPVTGQRWQTVADAQHQADASAATQTTTSMVHA